VRACVHMCMFAHVYACACAFVYVYGCTRVTHIEQTHSQRSDNGRRLQRFGYSLVTAVLSELSIKGFTCAMAHRLLHETLLRRRYCMYY